MNKEAKIALIQKLESQLSPKEYLIFFPPNEECLYTKAEILELSSPILYQSIPNHLQIVQKSQWVKFHILELLGYKRPPGLRIKQAKINKPKFLHQLLDIFVQSSPNLQVWNYIPYADVVIPGEWNEEGGRYRYQDCRYLLVFHNYEGMILKTYLVTGSELAQWDTTGTKTIKWQATVLRSYRNKISSKVIASLFEPIQQKFTSYPQNSLEKKLQLILREEQNLYSSLTKKVPMIKAAPNPEFLMTHREIEQSLEVLIGMEFENLGTGQERIIGQTLEKEIVKALGYQYYEQTDTGSYPDLLNQLIEVKFQLSGTVDLGKHLPTDGTPIEMPWNKWNFTNREIRYVIILVEQNQRGNFIVDSIVITSGAEFNQYFSICEGTNFKVQIPIPLAIMP